MEAALASSVELTTVGSVRLTLDGVEAPMSSRKALGLIVYLALQPNRSESRERVASMLWSNSGGDHARAALRQTLRRLKVDLGPAGDILAADRSTLRLTTPVRIESSRPPRPPAAASRQRCLPGTTPISPGCSPTSRISIRTSTCGSRSSASGSTAQLVGRLEAALAAADGPHRLALAEALTRVDPTHEGACRAAMQAHLNAGDPIQAMRLYERLWKVLDEELDVEPSERTQALYVAIKQGQAQPTAPAAVGHERELLAPIAILVEPTPVDDLPRDFRYIAETFRHEMIGALSRFRDWMVIDGPSAGGSPPTYRAYDLRLSMHHQQGSVAVSTTLNDHATGRCIWSERQSATLEDLVRVQRTTLRSLALALNVHLSAPRLQSARDMTSPMGRRYELWMQAQALMGEWRAESEDRADAILREIIAATPNFAPALVALAQINNVRPIIYPGRRVSDDRLEEALSLTSRAVMIDPLDSRAHLSRSWAHAMSGAHSAALSHMDLALDLNENDPWVIISAALGFAFAGELPRARELVEQAAAFGMRYSRAAQGYIATCLYLVGDYAAASDAADVAGDAIINLPAWQAAGRIRAGDPVGAAGSMAKFLHLAKANWHGGPNPSDEDALDWFMDCFPIRSDEVRDQLRRSLLAALGEKKRRLG